MQTTRSVEAIRSDLATIEERRRQTLEELCEAVKRDAGGELVQHKASGTVYKISRVELTPIVLTIMVHGKRRRRDGFAPYEELLGTPEDLRPAVRLFSTVRHERAEQVPA